DEYRGSSSVELALGFRAAEDFPGLQAALHALASLHFLRLAQHLAGLRVGRDGVTAGQHLLGSQQAKAAFQRAQATPPLFQVPTHLFVQAALRLRKSLTLL